MPDRFKIIYATCAIMFTLPSGPAPAQADGIAIPGVIRSHGNSVFLMDNHSTALAVWHSRGVKNATLVHLDTHDDCRFIEPGKIAGITRLYEAGRYSEAFKISDISFSSRYISRPGDLLFDIGNFIYPAISMGMITNFIWIVPDKALPMERLVRLGRHLETILPGITIIRADSGLHGSYNNVSFTMTTFERFTGVTGPCLLDIDIDFFAFHEAMSGQHIRTDPPHDPAHVFKTIARLAPDAEITTIAYSVSGGYTPLILGFIAEAGWHYFTTGEFPEYAEMLLDNVAKMWEGSATTSIPGPNHNSLFEPAWHHITALRAVIDGNTEAVADNIWKAASSNPIYAKGFIDASEAFINIGKFSEAGRMIDSYTNFIGSGTIFSDIANAKLLTASGKNEEALPYSLKVMNWLNDGKSIVRHASILIKLGRYNEAKSLLKTVLEAHPDDADAMRAMGTANEGQGDHAAAMRYYRAAELFNTTPSAPR